MGLHPDRLLPIEPEARAIARRLFAAVEHRPIVSPHGHTEPAWFAENAPFPDPAALFVIPDHYIFRMLYSQGIALEALGVPRVDGGPVETDPRAIWRLFAAHYHLFRGTPSRLWFEHSLETVFGITERLSTANADRLFDRVSDALATDAMRPRALFERFGIEVIATTDPADDPLRHHDAIRQSGWSGRVVPTYRPDAVVDPDRPGFGPALHRFMEASGAAGTFAGYLDAHRVRRAYFMQHGATATDHGHPTADTADLARGEAEALFARILSGTADAAERALFRAQMLTEMARMSLDDGLVMQIHPGSLRNHNQPVFDAFGFDKGADIPTRTDYVHALRPLLSALGNEPALTIILFTLDETAYARELAPLAGHYPALRLGPAWWFHDSPEGMRRFREMTTETAGFYNTVGFNDDTRAFLSIPARHDMARRVDCAFLARLVADGRLDEDEAAAVAVDLSGPLARAAYRL
ncbi:glucuronate isomerase [Aureimonas altamirensis]|uniref:glucuronate isomerase n=1 Tax=Aureimonas altamirensis TaxID=370622 RepID=UPI0020373CFC|nr:glucuronate isomerase [Aureimonas altamirensis]MCM2502382.1 glucuronate isomerase [Aureimonas altamirensis]